MTTIEEIYQYYLTSSGISTDSRNCPKNSLFFALKGDRFNGNLYALDALKRGSSYAIVDDENLTEEDRVLLVDDVLGTLQQLGTYHRKQLNIPILAITGTNGKTTTKELIASVLTEKYNVSYTKGNLNNHIGVPLTLLSMTAETEFGVVEMGANHKGEIELLCEIAQPNLGLITNIGKAHLEGFGSFDGVVEAKSEMYKYIRKSGGILFVNSGDELLMSLISDIPSYRYSLNSNIDSKVWMENMIQTPELELSWASKMDRSYFVTTKIIGGYNTINIMAAIAVGSYFNVEPEKINAALEQYQSDNNRSQVIRTEWNTVLLDAYNANPSSMEVALSNFDLIDQSRKVLFIGEMKELGDVSKEEHQKLYDRLVSMSVDDVFLVGNEFKDVCRSKEATLFENTDELIKYLKENKINDSYIFIKGSRGNALERIVSYL